MHLLNPNNSGRKPGGKAVDESKEENKGFTVTDKRVSARSEEEKKKADEEKTKQKTKEAGDLKKAQSSEPPEIDFSSFILSLSTSALIQLGGIADPITQKPAKNLQAAKQTIDILGIMQQKTKGNLTPQEQKLIDTALYDLRMHYVNSSKGEGQS